MQEQRNILKFYSIAIIVAVFSLCVFGVSQTQGDKIYENLPKITKIDSIMDSSKDQISPDVNYLKNSPPGDGVVPTWFTSICRVPKFDFNQSVYSYLDSNPTHSPEFDSVDINLAIPSGSEKCYFYKKIFQDPVLIYPEQKIRVTGDALFDTNSTIEDLVEHIHEPGDYMYLERFAVPIPTNLNFSFDYAIIPFMGGKYDIHEFIIDGNSIKSILLKNLANSNDEFWVTDDHVFPVFYDGREWIAQINEGEGDSTELKNIVLMNGEFQWDGDINHNPPLYGQDNIHGRDPNSADFLDNTGSPKREFAKVWFDGFEEKPKINVKIGDEELVFEDANISFQHALPFYLRFSANTGESSIVFDSITIYYKFDKNANIFSYRHDQNQAWQNISYALENATPPIAILGGANQTYYYRLFVDRPESEGYFILDASPENQHISIKFGKTIQVLGTDVNEDGKIDYEYYYPNLYDFGGGQANLYFVAHFKVNEFPSTHSSSMTEYIDTASGNPINLPNNQLDYYKYDLEYSNSLGVNWGLKEYSFDSIRTAFTDYGSRLELDIYGKFIVHDLSQTDSRVSMRVVIKER